MIGTIQGRYRILRKLGEGGQGEVFLVEHLHLGRVEALKVLRAELASDEQFVQRFRREARATNRVQHPNIVGVYDFGRMSDGRYFLAMEYVDGERLDAVIGGEPLPVARAVRIARQLARALAHAHGLGVVHRDLKPANLILVTHRGQPDLVKVLDFGMAKIVEPKELQPTLGRTLDGQMFGTAPYMAPEQFLERSAAPSMDVYGAGCLLFEMLTGRPPFAGNPVALMDQHLRATPEPPSRRAPSIPAALDELVLRALAKRPEDRFADAAALADALDRVTTTPPPAVRRSRLGVMTPRPDDDFGGETESEAGTHPGLGADEHPTLQLSRDDRFEVAGVLLQEVADALLDAGVTEPALVAQMAQLRDLRARVAQIRADAAACEQRAGALEQSAREREASLMFAIGELTFDRARAGDAGAALDEQIEALQQSLAALHDESTRQLSAAENEAVGLAAALDDALQAHTAACRAVERTMGPVVERAALPSLRQRLAMVRSLFQVDAG